MYKAIVLVGPDGILKLASSTSNESVIAVIGCKQNCELNDTFQNEFYTQTLC